MNTQETDQEINEVRGLEYKRGQNTAEYLVLLVLVTVGSIGIFTVFGKTVRGQISNVVAAMTGNTGAMNTTLNANATEAKARADKEFNMNGVDSDEVTFGTAE